MSAIRHIRKTIFNLSQAEFANAVGVAQSTVSRWESGRVSPSLVEVNSIRKAAVDRNIGLDDGLFFAFPEAAE